MKKVSVVEDRVRLRYVEKLRVVVELWVKYFHISSLFFVVLLRKRIRDSLKKLFSFL